MNKEQIEIAEKLIAQNELEQTFKNLMLTSHIANCDRVAKYKLPYKVIKEINEPLSKWYPNTEAPKDMIPWFVACFPGIEWDITNYTKDYLDLLNNTIGKVIYNDDGIRELSFDLKPEYEQMKNDYEQTYTTMNDSNRWYYLAHFLQGYDLENFTPFDLFGDTKHSTEEANNFRLECIKIQKDFETNTNNYYKGANDND